MKQRKTPEERVIVALHMLAEQTNRTLSDDTIEFYLSSLEKVGFERVIPGLFSLMESASFFPTVKQIKDASGVSELTDSDRAQCVPGEIVKAMGACGMYNQSDAKRMLSPLAWETVLALGGWRALNEEVSNFDQLPTLKAQWRRVAEVQAKRMNYVSGPPTLKLVAIDSDDTEIIPNLEVL